MAMRLMDSKRLDPLYRCKQKHINRVLNCKNPMLDLGFIRAAMIKYHPEVDVDKYLEEIQAEVDKLKNKTQQ